MTGTLSAGPGSPLGLGGLFTPVPVKTSAYTANPGEFVPCDTGSRAFTVTLPSQPQDGTAVEVKMVRQGGTNAVTVAAAGGDAFNVAGGGASQSLPLLYQGSIYQYRASIGVWYILGDDLALAQLDARYGGGGFTNPMTTPGDTIYGGASGAATRLAGDTSNTRKFMRTQSSAGVAQAPAWDTLQPGDIPSLPGSGQETLDNLGNITGAVTLAMASGSVFEGTLTGNVTFTFSGTTAGSAWSFTLFITQDSTGGRSVTFPGSVAWLGGVAPVIGSAPGAVTVYVFETLSNGTTWYGSLAGNDPSLPQPVANGGTGVAALTSYAVLAGGTTSTGAVQQVAALGTAGQPLISQGAGKLPAFGGALVPTVTALADAAPTLVNAALGNFFTWAPGASRTISAPTNPSDGQVITFAIQQPASGGPYTVTWTSGAGGYSFGTDGAPTLSTGASALDEVSFRYSAIKTAWLCQGWKLGF